MLSNVILEFFQHIPINFPSHFLHLCYATYIGILLKNHKLNNVINAEFNHKKYIYLNAFYTELKDQISVFLK